MVIKYFFHIVRLYCCHRIPMICWDPNVSSVRCVQGGPLPGRSRVITPLVGVWPQFPIYEGYNNSKIIGAHLVVIFLKLQNLIFLDVYVYFRRIVTPLFETSTNRQDKAAMIYLTSNVMCLSTPKWTNTIICGLFVMNIQCNFHTIEID